MMTRRMRTKKRFDCIGACAHTPVSDLRFGGELHILGLCHPLKAWDFSSRNAANDERNGRKYRSRNSLR